jgi:DNA polymerase-3 subunit gamma/tau
LVAFCGTSIDEQQVLEVFGLTAEQVVLDLSQAIITRESTKALHLIHGQQEAGKDLSKLLTDLLNFLRSLLIAQVDASSLQDEHSEKARTITASLKTKLNTSQLLRLMETLSEVEPTLKWATNKKLHLELAVIRAIQSLAEVGFNQVLDALEELRQTPSTPGPSGKGPNPTAKNENLVVPTHNPVAETEPLQRTPVTEEGTVVERVETAPVVQAVDTPNPVLVESPPAETVEVRRAQSSSASSETTMDEQELIHAAAESPDLSQLWIDIVTEVRVRRPLIQQYFTAAVPISLLHSELKLGFASDQSMAMETLLRPNNRKFIEQLLAEKLGQPTAIRGEIRDDLAPIIFPEKIEQTGNTEDDFKKDPLIQKALEIFQAEIQAAD